MVLWICVAWDDNGFIGCSDTAHKEKAGAEEDQKLVKEQYETVFKSFKTSVICFKAPELS